MNRIIFVILLFTSFNLYAEILHTAFQTKSAPKYIEDADNKGICYDIIQEINKELQNENIQIEEKTTYKSLRRIKYELKKGKIDVFFCMAKNFKREQDYVFIEIPIYEVSGVFSKRKSDKFEYINVTNLQGKTISTVAGSKTENEIKNIYGVKIDSSPNIVSALKKLSAGYSDLAYYHNISTAYTIKKFKMNNIKIIEKPFNKYFHYIAFNKNVDRDTIIKIEKALLKIKSNKKIEKILKKYLDLNDKKNFS